MERIFIKSITTSGDFPGICVRGWHTHGYRSVALRASQCRRTCSNKAIVPADLQLSCKREQKQIIFGYAERSRQSIKLICRNRI